MQSCIEMEFFEAESSLPSDLRDIDRIITLFRAHAAVKVRIIINSEIISKDFGFKPFQVNASSYFHDRLIVCIFKIIIEVIINGSIHQIVE